MDEKPEARPMGQVIQIDEARIRDHLGEMVRGTVEEALNAMLDAERVAMNVMRIMHCRSEQSVQLPCRKLSNTLTRAIIWALVQPRHTNLKKLCESTSKNRVSKRLIYVHYPNMCRSTGVDKHITQAVSSA